MAILCRNFTKWNQLIAIGSRAESDELRVINAATAFQTTLGVHPADLPRRCNVTTGIFIQINTRSLELPFISLLPRLSRELDVSERFSTSVSAYRALAMKDERRRSESSGSRQFEIYKFAHRVFRLRELSSCECVIASNATRVHAREQAARYDTIPDCKLHSRHTASSKPAGVVRRISSSSCGATLRFFLSLSSRARTRSVNRCRNPSSYRYIVRISLPRICETYQDNFSIRDNVQI